MKTTLLAAVLLITSGCATTRLDQLRNKADRVETALKAEQSKVLSQSDRERQQRLTHLSTLRGTLSAANVGLGAARYLPEEDRELAYDVLDEVYGTIDWNIPLGSGQPLRPLPSQFSNGVLKLR